MSDSVPAPLSELASLVDAEARLDRMLEVAREAASAERAAAHHRAELAAASLAIEIERERDRVATALAAATDAQVLEIVGGARAECARFDAVVGEALGALAHRLSQRLATLALEEAPS